MNKITEGKKNKNGNNKSPKTTKPPVNPKLRNKQILFHCKNCGNELFGKEKDKWV